MKSNIDENYLISERQRIGLRLKEIREAKNLTMQRVANDLNISKTTISKIEAGKWNFGIDTINTLGVYYEFKIDI